MISISIATENIYNCLLDDYHTHPIWPLVLKLNLSYTLLIWLILFSLYMPYRDFKYSKFQISSHIHFTMPKSFHRICSSLMSCVTFCDKLFSYSEELLAPHPTLKLEDHHFSSICGCLFFIFTTTLHIWRLSPPSAAQGHDMP
jgi:hypothetical protein